MITIVNFWALQGVHDLLPFCYLEKSYYCFQGDSSYSAEETALVAVFLCALQVTQLMVF